MDIKFTIPNEKVDGLVEAIFWLWPIPMVNNPSFGEEGEPEFIPEYEENEWAKEAIRRFLIKQHKRYLDFVAKEAIDTPEDNSLII
jgi:hypothetical protein